MVYPLNFQKTSSYLLIFANYFPTSNWGGVRQKLENKFVFEPISRLTGTLKKVGTFDSKEDIHSQFELCIKILQ